MDKLGRNDPCTCGSGKKFKKCCQSKMIGGKYTASVITGASSVSSFFKHHVSLSGSLASREIRPIRVTQGPVSPSKESAETTGSVDKIAENSSENSSQDQRN
jgi:hypothetical protein